MPGTEAENEASDGDGRMAAASAGEPTAASGGREQSASIAPAGATTPAGATAEPGDDHPGPAVSAGPAVQPEQASAEQVAADRAAEIEFNIAVDIIYNRARASWLTLCHRVFLLGAIIAGSTAASDLASAKLCAFAAAACAALDLVFDPATGAATYRELVRAAHDVLVDLKRQHFDAHAMDEAEVALLKMSGTETAPYHAAREIAFNQTRLAFGREDLSPIPVGRWRRAFAQVWRFEGG